MTAKDWILMVIAIAAVVYAAYNRIDRDNWKTRAEIAEAAGIVNRKTTPAGYCAGCMYAIKNAARLRQRATALALMKGGDFFAAQKTLKGGGSDG